jgi:hypothetical protein
VTVLANSFNLWIAEYHTDIDNCINILRDDLQKFRSFYSFVQLLQKTSPDTGLSVEQINELYRGFSQGQCAEIIPATRDYLLRRSGPEETLGPFGAAAAWLLRTESTELALIIGLLGFGFFGALAASFVREFSQTPGHVLPSVGFIIPALIRGVGAAILVFLLAKGGTAIFTRGDASPNAYAIFFACFIAAVFSEDVWSWARRRQRDQLPGANQSTPASGPTSPRGGQSTPASASASPGGANETETAPASGLTVVGDRPP